MLHIVYSGGDDILCRDPGEDRTEADSAEARTAAEDLAGRTAEASEEAQGADRQDRATQGSAGRDSAADRRTYRRRDSADGAVRTITEAGRDASEALS